MAGDAFQPETLYDLVGGDAGARRLGDRFYDVMDRDPEAATIRAIAGWADQTFIMKNAGIPDCAFVTCRFQSANGKRRSGCIA